MLKKFAATTSTAALAFGMLAAGAGVAAAADEETPETPTSGSVDTSSLGIEDFDLEKIAKDLGLASQALNGPVSVEGNAEGGPTVTYTNTTEDTQKCVGFTMPYSTVEDNDIDPNKIDLTDLLGALALLETIENGGKVSALTVDEAGKPVASNVTPGNVELAVLSLSIIAGGDDQGGAEIKTDGSFTWTATAPDEPGAASILCAPKGATSLEEVSLEFGVDKQVVADQVNGKIPGGSLDPVTTGSISGGSVAIGATALGSLAPADEAEAPETPEDPAE